MSENSSVYRLSSLDDFSQIVQFSSPTRSTCGLLPAAVLDMDPASLPDQSLALSRASISTSFTSLVGVNEPVDDEDDVVSARVKSGGTNAEPELDLLRSPSHNDHHSSKAMKRKMPSFCGLAGEGGRSKKRFKQQSKEAQVSQDHGPAHLAADRLTACTDVDEAIARAIPGRHWWQRHQALQQTQQQQNAEQQDLYSVDIEDFDETINRLVKQLIDASDEIRRLKIEATTLEALRQADAESHAHHMRVRQDMFLDLVSQREKAAVDLQNERVRWSKLNASVKEELQTKINELQCKIEDLDNAYQEENARLTTCLTSERFEKLENERTIAQMTEVVQQHKTLLQSAEEDLAALQRLDNEEKLVRDKKNRGLPPAYGSLDDDDALPPHGRHEDGGKSELAAIKYIVRNRFMRDLTSAQHYSDQLRESSSASDRAVAGQELYRYAMIAFAEACWSMNAIVLAAEETQSAERIKQMRRGDTNLDRPHRSSISKRTFIANRVAGFIIDMGWTIVASFDLRSLEINLTLGVKAEVGRYLRAVDDVLLEALQVAIFRGKVVREDVQSVIAHEDKACTHCHNTNCSGHCERMNMLQYFLSIIKSLRHRLDRLTAKIILTHTLPETVNWLSESIETERSLAARARLPVMRQISPAGEDALAINTATAGPSRVYPGMNGPVSAGRGAYPEMNNPGPVNAGRGVYAGMDGAEMMAVMAEVHADLQARIRDWGGQSAPFAVTDPHRISAPVMSQDARDSMTTLSHYATATVTDTERGTIAPGIMVRQRGANGQGDGDMFAVELGMLNEAEHVVVNQGLWHD